MSLRDWKHVEETLKGAVPWLVIFSKKCSTTRDRTRRDAHGRTVSTVLWPGCAQGIHPGLPASGRSRWPTPQRDPARMATMTAELLTLIDWLQEAGCTQVAMESSG